MDWRFTGARPNLRPKRRRNILLSDAILQIGSNRMKLGIDDTERVRRVIVHWVRPELMVEVKYLS